MSLAINTNIAALSAQRNLSTNILSLEISVQRLSSGLRVNTAKDDAAGLAISERLRAHIRSMTVAIRNSQDGISYAQTAEGGLTEIGNIILRMRELAEQAASGTYSGSALSALDNEYLQLKSEIDRIASVTEFNGTKLLNGAQSAGVTLQVGFQNSVDDRLSVAINSAGINALGLTGVAGSILIQATAQSALTQLDNVIATVAYQRGTLGAVQNRLQNTISNLQIGRENFSAADSRIRDADFAYETAQFTKNQILVQAATAILAQANVLPQNALTLLR